MRGPDRGVDGSSTEGESATYVVERDACDLSEYYSLVICGRKDEPRCSVRTSRWKKFYLVQCGELLKSLCICLRLLIDWQSEDIIAGVDYIL
jgi:hypothetical protein